MKNKVEERSRRRGVWGWRQTSSPGLKQAGKEETGLGRTGTGAHTTESGVHFVPGLQSSGALRDKRASTC